jgi:hypothetical protein
LSFFSDKKSLSVGALLGGLLAASMVANMVAVYSMRQMHGKNKRLEAAGSDSQYLEMTQVERKLGTGSR